MKLPTTLLVSVIFGAALSSTVNAAGEEPADGSSGDPGALTMVAVSDATPESAPGAEAPDAPPAGPEEIVVTATKRAQSVRTVAGAVTAVGRQRLEETGSSSLADYLALSPGVNLNSGNPGQSVITMRGVSTDTLPSAAQAAVGVYYDDIPLTDPGTPVVVPDIDAYDAERVEVMRGPQGALFGSSSLGGAINYIPAAPDPEAFAFSARAGGSQAKNAATGFSSKAMANVPIVEKTLGLRLVGHYTDTPGWIDNVGTGDKGANDSHVGGGRAILGWDVTPESKLRLTGLYQEAEVDDTAFVDGSGDLEKETLIPESSRNEITIGSLRYDHETASGEWSLIAGYQEKKFETVSDQTVFLGLQALGVPFVGGQRQAVDGYSAELRFASESGGFFDYLAGVSYADRDELLEISIETDLAALPRAVVDGLFASLGLPPPVDLGVTRLLDQQADVQAPELAAFADLTFRLTEKLKLAAGGRYYRNRVDADIEGEGVVFAPSGSLTFNARSKTTASGFNPRVSLSYPLDDDVMVYGLYSKGYRLGGINLVPDTPISDTETEYDSDRVDNFELGAKTSWLDRKLILDVTAFYIDWENIPLYIQDRLGLFRYLDNVGDARIFGVESSLVVRPTRYLTLQSAVTWNKATLQNDYDPQNGRPPVESGDRLPGAPEWTMSNTVGGRWTVGGIDPVVTLVHRYESESPSSLSYKDLKKGGYHQLDLRVGAKIDRFGITLFGRNLTDKRGITAMQPYAQAGGGIYRRDFIIAPRTFGVELDYSFGS